MVQLKLSVRLKYRRNEMDLSKLVLSIILGISVLLVHRKKVNIYGGKKLRLYSLNIRIGFIVIQIETENKNFLQRLKLGFNNFIEKELNRMEKLISI